MSPTTTHRLRTGALAIALALPMVAAPAAAQQNPRAHYRALPAQEVRSIEYDLVWVGATDAVTNGRIGRRDVQAIRDFEANNGLRADGVLRQRERRVLARQAERARVELGYAMVRDRDTGVRLGLPRALVGSREEIVGGTLWRAPDDSVRVFAYRVPDQTLEGSYRNQMSLPEREVTYDVLRDDFFVVAGRQNGREVYFRGETDGTEVRAFAVIYDPELADAVGPMIVAMSNDFEPFNAAPAARPEAPDVVEPRPGTACGGSYRVRRGDTLFAIALRCSVNVPALAAANPNVDPFSLQVGQVLNVPGRGGTFPPAPAPVEPAPAIAASLVSEPPREGGSLEVRASGFASGDLVEAGFGRDADRFIVTRVARADGSGRLRLTMRLPNRFRAGQSAVVAFATADGSRGATTRPFTVRPARAPEPPRRESLTVTGMLTTEGTNCPAMRDADGRLYTLAGPLPDYAPGTPVRVDALAGTNRQARACGQGRTVEVEAMARR